MNVNIYINCAKCGTEHRFYPLHSKGFLAKFGVPLSCGDPLKGGCSSIIPHRFAHVGLGD